MSAKQVDDLVKDETKMFMILASMKVERKVVIGKLPMVCDFLEMQGGVYYKLSTRY